MCSLDKILRNSCHALIFNNKNWLENYFLTVIVLEILNVFDLNIFFKFKSDIFHVFTRSFVCLKKLTG